MYSRDASLARSVSQLLANVNPQTHKIHLSQTLATLIRKRLTDPPECPILSASEGRETTPPPTYQTPLKSPLMRKIERLMNAAITAGKDFKMANTEVVACSNVSDVYLHGNLIARIGETWIELFDGGWRTNTTKSRLNAILQAHGVGDEGVFQKKGQWFFQSKDYGTIPFFSGMRIA